MAIRDTKYDIVTNGGNVIANSVAETAFFNSFVWRANTDLNCRAQHIKMNWKGWYSSLVGVPGTLTFRVRWGVNAGWNPTTGTLIAASGAIIIPTSQINQLFTLDLDLTIRNRGSGVNGKVAAIGRVGLNWGSSLIVDQLPVGGSDTSISLDTTAAAVIAITAQWSVANAANTLTLTDPSTIVYE